MKRTCLLTAVLAIACLAACTDVAPLVEESEKNEDRTITVTATIGDATKADFDENGKFAWSSDDRIALLTDQGYKSGSIESITGNHASFTVKIGTATPTGYAIYPADRGSTGDATKRAYYPDSYTQTALNSTTAPTPMVGKYVQGQDITFKHVGGLIRLKVIDIPTGTTRLVVKFDQKVTGLLDVDETTNPGYTFVKAGKGENLGSEVSFNVPGGFSTEQDMVLNIPVPTSEGYGRIIVNAYNGDTHIASMSAPGHKIERARGYKADAKHHDKAFFTTGNGQQIEFAPGNLFAEFNDDGSLKKWGFEPVEYQIEEYTGNAKIDPNTPGQLKSIVSTNQSDHFVSLFSWSSASTAYGICVKKLDKDYDGAHVDWGANDIYNSRTNQQDAAGTWRAPTAAELSTVINSRNVSFFRYVRATVCGSKGLVIFADEYVHPDGVTAFQDASFEGNVYESLGDWEKIQGKGAIFLPCAGSRHIENDDAGTIGVDYGKNGSYTTSSGDNGMRYALVFDGSRVAVENTFRRDGYSVRLIKDITVE